MRILVLQFVPSLRGRRVPRFDPLLGTMLALLKQRGHDVTLLGLSRADLHAVKSALARGLPQVVYADIHAVCATAARRVALYLQDHEFLPIVAGGSYSTLEPEACLSLPGVVAAALGEPDASLITYFERLKDPAVGQIVRGVWLRDERGLARPALPPLVEDLDSLPFPERDLFDCARQVLETGELEVAVGRGCPQRCGYCLVPAIAAMYAGGGQWTRRRSPGHVLAEICELRRRYATLRTIRFVDHAFALDRAWLDDFLAAYTADCALPYSFHLRANAADRVDARQLAASGARSATIEVISGSDFIRNDIFQMDLSDGQIVSAFAALREAAIRSRAVVYLGSPYESDTSLEQTAGLLRRLKPDAVDVRMYYPFSGTTAARISRENGWLHPRGEEQFHADQPGLNIPACRPEAIAGFVRRLRREWPIGFGEPWWRKWTAGLRRPQG